MNYKEFVNLLAMDCLDARFDFFLDHFDLDVCIEECFLIRDRGLGLIVLAETELNSLSDNVSIIFWKKVGIFHDSILGDSK